MEEPCIGINNQLQGKLTHEYERCSFDVDFDPLSFPFVCNKIQSLATINGTLLHVVALLTMKLMACDDVYGIERVTK